MRITIAVFALLATVYSAQAGLGKLGVIFGKEGATSRRVAIPQPTGDVLMVDGTSLILQTDGASLVCRAGGC